ncbi:hypothetical protein [Trichlorobacter ammonificans]|uniref:STAS domain-containing protein n=1 Tax=Trichlorobacter ammonificans TaxID=2916410 RepID=A0ABN8HGS7_9BACT|nr:hypothetical protein [Trichlorobacter ammonificans]CAH2031211.1 protein of unknown function [Trichlorobacter ammonificans]
MPLRLDTDSTPPRLILEGVVSIEETDGLLEALTHHAGIGVDLSGCEHLHTAPLQLLKLRKVPVLAPPADNFWLRCLGVTAGPVACDETTAMEEDRPPDNDWGLFN